MAQIRSSKTQRKDHCFCALRGVILVGAGNWNIIITGAAGCRSAKRNYSSSMKLLANVCGTILFAIAGAALNAAPDEDVTTAPVLRVPDGFSIELVAGSPLVERPIVA